MLVALAAVTVGPFIGGWIAHRQIISSMRQQWIENLRVSVAEFLAQIDDLFVFHDPSDKESELNQEALKRMAFLEHRIELTLNPSKERSRRLIHAVHRLADLMSKRDLPESERTDVYATLSLEIIAVTQEILQAEWKKTKQIFQFRRRSEKT